jgi:hypothetical protein
VGNERVSIVEALKRLRELGTARRYTGVLFSIWKPVHAGFEQQPTEQQQGSQAESGAAAPHSKTRCAKTALRHGNVLECGGALPLLILTSGPLRAAFENEPV